MEWLGRVPEHWDVRAIKWLSPVQRGASPRPIDDQKYFDDENGEYGWVRIEDVSSSDGILLSTKQRLSEIGSNLSVKLQPGALFLSIAGTVGKPCITKIKACIHDGFVYFPYLEINPSWLFKIFESRTPFVGLGKLGTQLNLNTETVGGIKVAISSASEIESTLNHLDRETTRIDTLIAKKTRFIELVSEKIVALACDCLGMPEDEWIRLAHVADVIRRPVAQESDEKYTKLGLLNRGRGIFKKDESDQEDMGDSDFYWVEHGDLVLSGQFSWEGAIAVATDEHTGCVVSHRFPIIRGRFGKVLTEYLFALFMSEHGDFMLNDCSRGSAGRNKPLNMNLLLKWKIPVPSIEYQQQIAKLVWLRERMKKANERSITLLKERRSALITAAVTGQIDLREAA